MTRMKNDSADEVSELSYSCSLHPVYSWDSWTNAAIHFNIVTKCKIPELKMNFPDNKSGFSNIFLTNAMSCYATIPFIK